MMKTFVLVFLHALPALSTPLPAAQATIASKQFQTAFNTGGDCTEADNNGQNIIDVYYNLPTEVPIRLYNLSRDLYNTE